MEEGKLLLFCLVLFFVLPLPAQLSFLWDCENKCAIHVYLRVDGEGEAGIR